MKKKDVEMHMKTKEPVERELFHGTASDIADSICVGGFDRGFAGKNGELTNAVGLLQRRIIVLTLKNIQLFEFKRFRVLFDDNTERGLSFFL